MTQKQTTAAQTASIIYVYNEEKAIGLSPLTGMGHRSSQYALEVQDKFTTYLTKVYACKRAKFVKDCLVTIKAPAVRIVFHITGWEK
ncbi:hypothetical protein DPMN_167301 [Dreissena polymorpha]|uniref:Uncharacterized protein n=1 Tax=Dreissena polymorpha TaxID=45954 RepID=A0A9D4EYJ1_DREPO|nr:hypothetical protein DPMN_167301 [Dreissena polymorpha]